jgi:hypothetical protein
MMGSCHFACSDFSQCHVFVHDVTNYASHFNVEYATLLLIQERCQMLSRVPILILKRRLHDDFHVLFSFFHHPQNKAHNRGELVVLG